MLKEIRIEGFKSLRDVTLRLGKLNVLIGDNSSGKSNLLQFFDMLGWMIRGGNLQNFIKRAGGGSSLLFDGPKQTSEIEAHLIFEGKQGENEYTFNMIHAPQDTLRISQERYRFSPEYKKYSDWQNAGGDMEAGIARLTTEFPSARYIVYLLQNCVTYHFNDTSFDSPIKRRWDSSGTAYLRDHAGNLAPLLLKLQEDEPQRYEFIEHTIQRIFPQFGGFELQEESGTVILRWRRKGSDYTFGAHLTSDGSLRFMALATLLNMPPERLPNTILLDEPELGLHPHAIELLGGLIQILSKGNEKQIIVATQSPLLVDQFTLDSTIIVEMGADGATSFKELEADKYKDKYKEWLKEYSLSELWRKNVLEAMP